MSASKAVTEAAAALALEARARESRFADEAAMREGVANILHHTLAADTFTDAEWAAALCIHLENVATIRALLRGAVPAAATRAGEAGAVGDVVKARNANVAERIRRRALLDIHDGRQADGVRANFLTIADAIERGE